MRIEFIGLPGAGKTTLRRKLIDGLRGEGSHQFISSEEAFLRVARSEIDRVFRLPLKILPASLALALARRLANRSIMQFDAQNRFVAKYGLALGAFLRSDVFARMSEIDRERVIGNFLSMGSVWQVASSDALRGASVLFEEGLVQKSFMFVDHAGDSASDEANVVEYLENIPVSDLVVNVSTSVDTSYERMCGRPDGLTDRLAGLDESVIRDFLETASAHIATVDQWLRSHHGDNYVVFDGESDADTQLRALIQDIRSRV